MPWWGKSQDSKPEQQQQQQQQQAPQNQPSEPSKALVIEKFPPEVRKIPDTADKSVGILQGARAEGVGPDSTDSNVRYAAYATRIRTILLSAHRYVAYTSDIGESFRPVAHPYLVRGAYGVSWLYLLGDVSYEGYKAYWHNQRILDPKVQLTARQEQITGLPATETREVAPGVVSPLEDYRTVMVQRAIFQSVASMGLPAFTIHSIVRYSGRAMKNMKNNMIRTWTPIGLGLSVVPFLPAMFDEPVENAVEWVFHRGFETFGGHKAVGDSPTTGRETLLRKPKQKEL